MLIGEIVQRTGLSKDTIRFYEKQGLISIGRKARRLNNYKEYSEETLLRLLTVKKLKQFGFTLNECIDMLDTIQLNQATCQNMAEKLVEKVKIFERKIEEITLFKNLLSDRIAKCQRGCNPSKPNENCPAIIGEN
jgi:DNA-binding transcriptional MerR regulator